MKVTLMTGPGCHLCDDAYKLLKAVERSDLVIEKKNIRDDHDLYHRYAVLIPVLRREDNLSELLWPFDQSELEQFLA
ncbi:glutaredoxin family protein [Alteromonas flava]|uniref:glutaredoxin family protein n=1 Tax=Alteromonas flava TaxID=2048003 RepID=UPI000C28135C|nr:glutaredoxin family protein [Alteromonas flava]